MPFEKNFRRLSFSSNIIKIPESSKRRSIEKRERKSIEKREKKKNPRVSSNKRGSQYFERKKHCNIKILFV
jgi:hypothetical protein